MKKRVNIPILIICFVIVYAIAFVGSVFTSKSVNTEWYEQIKPLITPPNYVFPIVWNILFFLIALSLYIAIINTKGKTRNKIIIIFAINLILNTLWSYLFFSLKNPVLAFYDLILICISIIVLIILTYKINKISSYLLIPYLAWVSFAGILNYLIMF